MNDTAEDPRDLSRELTRDEILDRFLDRVSARGLTLYPAQEEAILEVFAGKNVILGTPTGSGKSLVALAMHDLALNEGRRSFYACPIKALVSEKFFDLCREYGPESVGMMTGDASVNRDAPIICCTAEVLANMALREGNNADVDYAILDEFHYYSDRERGIAWQIPLLALPQTTFLLMSATLGDAVSTKPLAERLSKLNGHETVVVTGRERPVPLDFVYKETPLHETIADLAKKDRTPLYLVNFTQRACAEEAQNLMSVDLTPKETKKAIAAALVGEKFTSPYGKELQRFLRHGIGIHHAGLLPRYRRLVEKLAKDGLLPVICGTDTLGVGVNIPIRTVVFTKLCKYDGEKTAILSVRDFQQIAGRAGRRGYDTEGTVVAQAPEHVIENLRLEAKAGNDPGKRRKIVRKKPPDRGYVPWDKSTFTRLIESSPEPLVSRFGVSHGMLLNVLQRDRGGCRAMARLIQDSHERLPEKRIHGRKALLLYKSLLDAGILEKDENGIARLSAQLQDDFSLHQSLSLYLIEVLPVLDPASETYALDVLSFVEAILENPDIVLQKQLDKLKSVKMAEMKAAGIEFDERIAELDKMEYPKPNKDLIYNTFNEFAAKHPWLQAENIRPKGIAREMIEQLYGFSELVREYALERSEGLVLRYLSDVYKTLVQVLPAPYKTPEVDDMIVTFGAIVRQIDSSLLDEWEAMQHPQGTTVAIEDAALAGDSRVEGDKTSGDITRDEKAFTVLVRNALFALVRAIASYRYDEAAALLEAGEETWTATRIEAEMKEYYVDHGGIRTDADARSPKRIDIHKGDPGSVAWRVTQGLADPDGHDDWALHVRIDLAASAEAGRPVLTLDRIGL
jgi:superfamily II RNA helicase